LPGRFGIRLSADVDRAKIPEAAGLRRAGKSAVLTAQVRDPPLGGSRLREDP